MDLQQPSAVPTEPAAATSGSVETQPEPVSVAARDSRPWWQTRQATAVALALILVLGAYLRSLSLTDWDQGTGQHPDERFFTSVASSVRVPGSFGEYIDSSRSPGNPRNYRDFPLYVYGPFPIALTRMVALTLTPAGALPETVPSISAPPAGETNYGPLAPNPERGLPRLYPLQMLLNPEGKNLTAYFEIYKVGRALATIFDLGSIMLVFLIGSRLYDRRVGLLAALFAALSVMQIQQSHFFVDPIFSTFFALLALYWAVRVAQGGGWPSYVFLGASIGLAMANRITLATMGLVAIAAAVIAAIRMVSSPGATVYTFFSRQLPLLVLAGIVTLFTFRTFQPDAFIGSRAGSPPIPGEQPSSLDFMIGWGFFDLRPDPRFLGNLQTVRALVTGEADYPPSQQWVHRTAYLFPWQNMVLWGMGPALGLAAWVSWTAFAVGNLRLTIDDLRLRSNGARNRHIANRTFKIAHPAWVLWVWIAFYFAWQGNQFAITMRYMLPIYGPLMVFAAWGLLRLWDGRQLMAGGRGISQTRRSVNRLATVGYRWLPVLVVIVTGAWAYAFSRIYTQPHSRIIAAHWVLEHAPPGSAIASEIWDDPLPLQVGGGDPWRTTYRGISTAPYAEDEPDKYFGSLDGQNRPQPGLLDQLEQADYITLTSNRVYASATRLPMRYPALTRYYHYLFSGELGFELVADITSYPRILGLRIPDQGAEEAFSVYDHPRVLIFQKTPAFSRERAAQLLTGDVNWGEVYKLPVSVGDRTTSALRLTESQWPLYRAGGTWSELFSSAGIAGALAPLIWLLVLELLGLAGFALLFRLLPWLPDRGFSLARALALLLVAYLAWLLGSLRVMSFTPATVWLCALPLLVLGAGAAWGARAELRAFWRARRAALLSAWAIYLGFFLLGLLLRWYNPDLWHPARGGEKPMDFAYLNAVLKSAAFPPYDPWHAGGYINYYYFGFVIVGALVHLTTVTPAIAYNLIVPTLFALTALGAWGAVYNLLAAKNREPRTENRLGTSGSWFPSDLRPFAFAQGKLRSGQASLRAGSVLGSLERRALISAALAPVFVLLLGNLAQAVWFLNGYAAEQAPRGRPEWAFWDATRIIEGTVNEFPFFTFLFADLHAHMIVMPFSLAMLGLGVALVRTGNSEQRTENREQGTGNREQGTGNREQGTEPALSGACPERSRRAEGNREQRPGGQRSRLAVPGSLFVVLILLGLLAGALRATNTWDYPTFVGLTAVTIALATWHGESRRGATRSENPLFAAGRWALLTIIQIAAVILVGNLLFLPFTANFVTESSGVELLRAGQFPSLIEQVLHAQRTPLWDLLRIYGLWLFLVISAGVALARDLARRRGTPLPPAFWVLAGATLAIGLAGLAAGWSAPVLLLPLVAGAAWLAWQLRRAAPRTLLPLLWAGAALALTLMVDLVVVKGDVGRLNTVFKFGLHAWNLFALAAAVALPWLWTHRKGEASAGVSPKRGAGSWADTSPLLWRGAALLLLAAAAVYPLTATPARLADRYAPNLPRTLDGMAFMRADLNGNENGRDFPLAEDAAAIAWLQQHVTGTPVILEAHLPSYRWAGRVATYTGLPTILGWEWHQIQQRMAVNADPIIRYRQSVISQIYNTPDPNQAINLLKSYAVEYLYVGGVERAIYDANGLAKFDGMARLGMIEPVFTQGGTTIYRVADPGQPTMLTTDLPVRTPTTRTPPPLVLDQPVNELPPVGGYAWNGLASASSWAALIVWLLALYLLALLGLPLAVTVFGRWRDGGVIWARLIGLLLLGYAIWLPASLKIWRYDYWGMLSGLLLLLLLNAGLLIQLGWQNREQRAEQNREQRTENRRAANLFFVLCSLFSQGLRAIAAHLRARRRAVLIGEGLFLTGFALFAAIRALNPDLWHPVWGGEKPMEMGFLNAIVRSPVMPPYDPFYSDGFINYYYYGFFLISVLIRATGIAPALAFNLAIPTIFALTLAGGYAIVAQISGRVRYGLLGAAFLALLGNLAAVIPSGQARGIDPVLRSLADGGLAGFGARLGDWFWGPSRVISSNVINEFPFWAFLYADLHPHLIALPITLLAIALGWRVVDRRPALSNTEGLRIGNDGLGASNLQSFGPSALLRAGYAQDRSAICNLSIALTLGALAVTNSWDFPTYTLLTGAAMVGAAWRSQPRGIPWLRLARAALTTIAVALGGLALYAPFFDHFYAFVGGVGLVRDFTQVTHYLIIYGVFLAVLLPFVLGAALRVLEQRAESREQRAESREQRAESREQRAEPALPPSSWLRLRPEAQPEGPGFDRLTNRVAEGNREQRTENRRRRTVILVLCSLFFVLLVLSVALPDLGLRAWLAALLLTLAWLLLQRRIGTPAWFALLLAALAWAVSLGIEVVFIRDHLAGGDAYRMNTVFKFGFQIWTLSALAAAAGLPFVLRGLRRIDLRAARRAARKQGRRQPLSPLQAACVVLLGALGAAAAVFPLAGTPSRVATRFPEAPGPTLDGLAFLRNATFAYPCGAYGGCEPGVEQVTVDLRGDADAIAWLNKQISGTPIVVQSNLWFYRAYGIRVAASTGLPTVISALHANEQRDPFLTGIRDRDLEDFYRTADVERALRFLAKYRVNYVYVGGVERAFYNQAGLRKFDAMRDTYLDAVYDRAGVQIFRVRGIPQIYAEPEPVEFGPEPVAAPAPPAAETRPADLEALERQVAANPTNGPMAFGLADRYRALGRLDDAIRVLAAAAPANPNDVGLHHLWGDILSQAQRYAEAEQAYIQAARAQPTAGNWNKVGAALLEWGELAKAELALTQAVAIDPSVPEPHFHLGQLYARQGNAAAAIASLETYLQLAPDGRFSAQARQLLAELNE